MKKILNSIIYLIVIVTVLSGCQQDEQKTNKAPKKATENKVSQKYDAKQDKEDEKSLEPYNGVIHHLFVHPNVPYPKRAFTGEQAKGYFDWMLTTHEFEAAIKELHKNNYILIDPHDAYDFSGDKVKKKELKLPKGKKPLILSIDDMNYYDYMRKNGNVNRLVLNENKEVISESTDDHGKTVKSSQEAIVPILNEYVKEHKDFSYKGAKGVVALTGYEGVLGYRTNELDSKDYEKRKQDAKEIVKVMKRDGWQFGSHSYGHINFTNSSYNQIVQDTKRWKKEVEPIIGKTDLFIYPFGARVEIGSPAFKYLSEKEGFKLIASVGPQAYEQLTPHAVTQDRIAIDGLNLSKGKYKLKPYMDPDQVFNKEERKYFKGGSDSSGGQF